MSKLPISLQEEPLIEAVFEIRFAPSGASLADVLPGFLFHQLQPKPQISRLPPADIPQPIRMQEPNLMFAPIQQIETEEFRVLVGDRSIVIGCKIPYPKWKKFKDEILRIVPIVESLGLVHFIERYSIKYINIISGDTIEDQLSKVNLKIDLADKTVTNEPLTLRLNRTEGDTLHVLTLASGATASLQNGGQKSGIVVDVDSIREPRAVAFPDFLVSLADNVESLRQENKAKFFGCLTESAIQSMGPSYE